MYYNNFASFLSNQNLHPPTDSIARSHQLAAETDEIGVEIIDELGRQRETLVRTKDRVSQTLMRNHSLVGYHALEGSR
jgi:hypothetical protein